MKRKSFLRNLIGMAAIPFVPRVVKANVPTDKSRKGVGQSKPPHTYGLGDFVIYKGVHGNVIQRLKIGERHLIVITAAQSKEGWTRRAIDIETYDTMLLDGKTEIVCVLETDPEIILLGSMPKKVSDQERA